MIRRQICSLSIATEFTSLPSRHPLPLAISSYLRLLPSLKHLGCVLQLHCRLIVSGLKLQEPTISHLINSYCLLQIPDYARSVFDSIPEPCVVSWNSMIRAYTRARRHKEALELYRCLIKKGLEPDKYTFTFVLKACAGVMDVQEGILIHRKIADMGLDSDAYVGTGLVCLYCKVGDLMSARKVFDKMTQRDVVAWNAMISGLAQSSHPHEALRLFREMQSDGGEVDYVTLLNLIPAVSKIQDVDICRSIHGYVIRRDFKSVVYNGLIDTYCKCFDVYAAESTFRTLLTKDDVSWATMMAGYAYNGCFFEVLNLFDRMRNEDVKMNKVAATSALLACSELRELEKGTLIHEYAVRQGIDKDASVATSIVTMYAKCGALEKAKRLFRTLKERDVVAWSGIVSASEQAGYPEDALSLFRSMMSERVKPNNITLISVLRACAGLCSLRMGKSVHCYAMKANLEPDPASATAILSMYAKFGLINPTLTIFYGMQRKDVVTWNALMNGYVQIGAPESAFQTFNYLLREEHPNRGTMLVLLQACEILNETLPVSVIHGQIIKHGFRTDHHVGHALVDTYAKCGCLDSAETLFNNGELKKCTVSWNTLITGYLHNGFAEEAISVFRQMKLGSFQPNVVTFVGVLPAATNLADLREGMCIHASIIKMGYQQYTTIGNSLIDMYAKCGRLEHSRSCFDELRSYKNTVSWNTLLSGYAIHGLGHPAVSIFSTMQESGVEVDAFTFLSVLSACRHSGLVEEGQKLFTLMQEQYNLEPDSEHYGCMVDLLGRAGLFREALDLIKRMPLKPKAGVWGALLSSSRSYSHFQLVEMVLGQLVKLEPENPSHFYVVSTSCSPNTSNTLVKKDPGCSWVEIFSV